MQIKRFETDGYRIDGKRLYIPIEIHGTCVHCRSPIVLDYFESPIIHAYADKVFSDSIHCKSCGKYTDIKVKLKMNIELVQPIEEVP